MPCLRQAVLAAADLERTVDHLRSELALGEPFRDPLVAHFGLANAVFAIGDQFLEVVSPLDGTHPGARPVARRLEASPSGVCGHMAMLQVCELAAARARAAACEAREVFAIELEEIAEVHIHPGDAGGAIVSLSEPRPPASWHWGGPRWRERSVPGRICCIDVAVDDPPRTARRWAQLAGGALSEVRFLDAEGQGGGPAGIVGLDLELGEEGRQLRLSTVDGWPG